MVGNDLNQIDEENEDSFDSDDEGNSQMDGDGGDRENPSQSTINKTNEKIINDLTSQLFL